MRGPLFLQNLTTQVFKLIDFLLYDEGVNNVCLLEVVFIVAENTKVSITIQHAHQNAPRRLENKWQWFQ